MSCRDVNCTVHGEQIEGYTIEVLEAVESVSRECLAHTGGAGAKSKSGHTEPGWSDYVKPYSEESKFWFAVWWSAGKPGTGALHDAMIFSKRQFKHAVRRLKRANDKIQNDKFVESLLSGGVNIFKEIKKHRGASKTVSSRIDDEVGDYNIANRFANIYSMLYNQHANGTDFDDIKDKVSASIGAWSIADVDRITVDVVEKALKNMKNGKNDNCYDIQSECFSQGPKSLTRHLTNLLKTFVVHGTVPYFVLICTLLPLVKDNLADITSSDNYRAIASGSLLLKLLDLLILILDGDKLACDQLQFGFQSGSSTSMCT